MAGNLRTVMADTASGSGSMLDAALGYAREYAWSVFPVCTPILGKPDQCLQHSRKQCKDPGKTPLVKWGAYQDEVATEHEMRAWWQHWPTANIAMATGATSDAVVVDLDNEFALTEAERRGYDPGPWVRTGRVGGRHLYFRHRPDAPTIFAKRGGIDFRGQGGYVLLPPSLHKLGTRYGWGEPVRRGEPLPVLPSWIDELATTSSNGEANGRVDFDSLLRDGIDEGRRDQELFRAASKLRGADVPYELAVRLIRWAGEQCHPPFDLDEAKAKVDSAYGRYSPNGHHLGGQLAVVRMSEVKPEPIQWLWRGRFARGKATLLMGDPGLGKSLITHWMSALISTGGTWPDGGQCEQGAAILFTIEDGLADTVAPRLLVAGADMKRVVAVRGVLGKDDSLDARMFELTQHLELLGELIEQEKASLVVMDPVTAYLGPDVNSHKESDVRAVLGPLQLLAERTGITLAMLMHLNKGSGVSALYRAIGSIAFPAVARVVLGVAPDPNDEEGKRRLMLPVKMNIGQLPSGIGYRIETASHQGVLRAADAADQPPRLVWDNDPVTIDVASAMDRSGSAQEMGALEEAKSALSQILASGRVLASEGKRQIKDSVGGVSEATLIRARKELGIRVRKEGFQGAWWWEPPIIPQNSIKDSLEALQPMQPLEGSKGYIDSNGSNESLRAPAREAVQSMGGGVVSVSTEDEAMPGTQRCRVCRSRLFADEQEVCERCQ